MVVEGHNGAESGFCSPSSSGKHPPAEGNPISILGNLGPLPPPAPAPRHPASYPKGLQVREVSLGAEQHVVGHAEALPHTKVVEERGLRQGAAHLQHHHVCGGTGGGPEPRSLVPQAGEEPGRLSWLRWPPHLTPAGYSFALASVSPF